jgi:tetratricopeptide (TPR) repeat protein
MRLSAAGILACTLTFALTTVQAQTSGTVATPHAATAKPKTTPNPANDIQTLLGRANNFEIKGRIDLAEQLWKQVLLSDPRNTEALGGLARGAKLDGNTDAMNQYLDRIRAINPNDTNLARVQSMIVMQGQQEKLDQAGKLAQAGKYSQAMDIYREIFGNSPPAGEWALAYYETEAATPQGKPAAIAGLRDLIAKYPKDSRYQIVLGRILTYDAHTRSEGQAMLAKHPSDPEAMDALRQSLLWDSSNPTEAAAIRAYLEQHHDAQLAGALHNLELKKGAAQPIPQTPEEKAAAEAERARAADEAAAYKALNAKHFDEAEQRFKAILDREPENTSALSGMGYVRMEQQNFGGAISYMTQAIQDGSKDPSLQKALDDSRFYYAISEGGASLNENDLVNAEAQYRSALQMRPNAPEGLLGLAGTLMKAQQPEAALTIYVQYVKKQPTDPDGWKGLFQAQYEAGHPQAALDTERKIPVAVHAKLMKDPEYLRTLASCYMAVGRDADAQKILKSALDMPFPNNGKGLQVETQMQYADLLQLGNHKDQAAGLYRQVLTEDPANVNAWQGLVRVEHEMGQDAAAVQSIESMPPGTYDMALKDPGFLSTLAAIYDHQNQPDVAQGFLEKAISAETAAGQQPSIPVELQLADIYMKRGNSQQAYSLYRQVLMTHPERLDAWKGLLNALHATGHDREAVAQVQQIPLDVRKQLELDPEYLQTMAGVYDSLGEPTQAAIFLHRVQADYAARKVAPPADIQVQDAWLLFNSGNDVGLYNALMQLGSRTDLTDAQRRDVQTIWASWATRRADQAITAGHIKLGLTILNAAARAFPDNPGVLTALAGGYMSAGETKQAEVIFKAQDMSAASDGDYRSAVSAALANGDTKQAEIWLRYGLNLYPHDSQLLSQAAKFEQARGDIQRAADYYKASLAAMPPPDPGAELAAELSRPVPAGAVRLPNGNQPQDLTTLLAPGTESALTQPVQTAPYLPSYANQYGQPPVVLNNTYGYTTQPVVPNYMCNQYPCAPTQTTNPTQQVPNQNQRLRDYVPQSKNVKPRVVTSADEVLVAGMSPAEALTAPARASETPVQQNVPQQTAEVITYAPVTAEAATPQQVEQPVSTPPVTESEYRPYVPYSGVSSINAESLKTSEPASYVPPQRTLSELPTMSVTVSTTAPSQTAQQTDVLPPIHYVQNAPESAAVAARNSVHPDIAGYQAEDVRAQQSQPDAKAKAMEGVSAPPQENIETAQYSGGANVTDNGDNSYQMLPQQTKAPKKKPQAGTTTDVQAVPPSTSNDNAQQYPQPGTQRARPYTTGRSARTTQPTQTVQPEQQPPMAYPPAPAQYGYQPYPQPGAPYPLGTPPTDNQLMQHNIPPLRGDYNANQPLQPTLSERDQTTLDLAQLEASYSGWLGGTGIGRYRSGTPGMDQLTDLEVPFEASATLLKAIRLSVIPRAVFLNPGVIDATNYTGTPSTTNYIPFLGTVPINAQGASFQQPATGVGGEIQFVMQNFAVSGGYTPYEFLVRNWTGHVMWRIAGGPFTFFADRDNVKDTILSYAGMHDPGTASAVSQGNIWGGVMQTGGGLRFDKGNEKNGLYIVAEGADLSGYHVLENTKIDGTMGAYWRAKVVPEYGTLNVGTSFYAEHYTYNELSMTYGLGGYFSPNVYFLAAVPITFNGHYGVNWHYVLDGSIGIQAFEEAGQNWFPLDPAEQTGIATEMCPSGTASSAFAQNCARTPLSTNVALNYNLDGQFSYHIAEHWFIGGFLNANDTSNYNEVSGGFFVRYLFRSQYPTVDYPTGLFPHDGFRPLRVP